MRIWIAGVLASLAIGCGGDAGTGLGGTDIRGQWSYDVTNLSLGGVTCVEHGTTLTITNESGGTFSGSYSGGTWVCSGAGGTDSSAIGTGTLINGVIKQDTVRFYPDDNNWYSVGTLTGATMAGTANLRFPQSTTPVVVAANWSAAKH